MTGSVVGAFVESWFVLRGLQSSILFFFFFTFNTRRAKEQVDGTCLRQFRVDTAVFEIAYTRHRSCNINVEKLILN